MEMTKIMFASDNLLHYYLYSLVTVTDITEENVSNEILDSSHVYTLRTIEWQLVSSAHYT